MANHIVPLVVTAYKQSDGTISLHQLSARFQQLVREHNQVHLVLSDLQLSDDLVQGLIAMMELAPNSIVSLSMARIRVTPGSMGHLLRHIPSGTTFVDVSGIRDVSSGREMLLSERNHHGMTLVSILGPRLVELRYLRQMRITPDEYSYQYLARFNTSRPIFGLPPVDFVWANVAARTYTGAAMQGGVNRFGYSNAPATQGAPPAAMAFTSSFSFMQPSASSSFAPPQGLASTPSSLPFMLRQLRTTQTPPSPANSTMSAMEEIPITDDDLRLLRGDNNSLGGAPPTRSFANPFGFSRAPATQGLGGAPPALFAQPPTAQSPPSPANSTVSMLPGSYPFTEEDLSSLRGDNN